MVATTFQSLFVLYNNVMHARLLGRVRSTTCLPAGELHTTYHPSTEIHTKDPTAQFMDRMIPRPNITWIVPTAAPVAMPMSSVVRAHGTCGRRCNSLVSENCLSASV